MIKTKERKRKSGMEKKIKIMKQREPEAKKERKKKVSKEECERHFGRFLFVSFSPQFSLYFGERIF